jgi:hypothetical protein
MLIILYNASYLSYGVEAIIIVIIFFYELYILYDWRKKQLKIKERTLT